MTHKKMKKQTTAIIASSVLLFASVNINAQSETTVPATLAAQTDTFIAHYRDYANAGYVVEWPVSAGGVNAVRSRLGRYAYLGFFTSSSLIQNTPLPLVQLGFFRTRAEAEKFVQDNSAAFAGLRVVGLTPSEHKALFAGEANWYWLSPATEDRNAGVQAILAQAKNYYMNQQYQQALNYYALLSLSSNREISAWGQELMGLTYERLGQTELALRAYRELIAGQNEGNWTERVKQRLRALETAADDGQDALRKSKYENQNPSLYYRGVFGQSYNYMERGGDGLENEDVFSVLATNYDFTAGYRHSEHKIEVRLAGYDQADMLDHVDDDKTAIKRFYVDYTQVSTGLNVIAGRHKDYDSGQYSYFDGLSIKYPLSSRWKIGFNAGVPVHFSDFYDYMDREFYSLQTNFRLNDRWSFAGYLTHQTVYGEIDRAAYGGTVQYYSPKFTSYLNLDYDYEFAEINVLRWQGTYHFDNRNHVTASYGRQRSPFLTATNILIGQPYLNLEQYLRNQFNRDYLLHYALERTSLFEYGTLNYHWKIDDSLQIVTDLYHSVSTDIPIFMSEDDGLSTIVDSTDGEYRYSSAGVQAVVDDFFGVKDSATLGLRLIDTTLSSSTMLHIGERFRLFDSRVFLTPKAHLKYSQRKSDETAQTNVRGSLAISYRPWRNTELRLEAGNELIRDVDAKINIDYSYLFVGYQVRF
jgi:hypothetical protein